METIIRRNVNINNKKVLETEKKRLMLYNAKQEIFIYQYKNEFGFPYFINEDNKNFENEFYKQLGIRLIKDNIHELITIVDYERILVEEKRKLKEAYKKLTSVYYSYYIEFDEDILNRLINYSIQDSKYEYLDLVSIDELIEHGDSRYDKHSPALKKLKRKLNYEEY